ncbi:GEVED domain-containing protein [Chryseobacterium sp. JV558]|uniref:GEVED domain-containing protein n=1 Tax=Chryseobacterium sp. JV558 TaxID=2663236 RepID=UPI00299F4161|nr:GEVED domain-containing protein [Chryseobacterium sp. JV558]MDW9379851.1 T9SS type A sorting domain-containing protein [Chryseobacterium sp. JV558]
MKKFFTSFILFLCLICTGFVSKVSAQAGQIGTGTGTSVYLPIRSYYGYSYSQQIYTAAELTTAIGTSNYITAVKFYSTTVATSQDVYKDWVVYMGNTTQTNFATITNWVPFNSLTQVFAGTLPNLTNGNWVTLQLATPFLWNGTDNLVIAVNEKTPGYASSPGTAWGSYNAGANRGMIYYEDSANPDPAAPPAAKDRLADIPRIQLESHPLPACSTAPPTNITVSNLTTATANVGWYLSAGATYVVRYRPVAGGPWVTINVTTPLVGNQLITGLTEQTQYEVQVATICGGVQGAFSSSVNFTTPALTYCASAATSTFIDGYISQVSVNAQGAPSMTSNSNQSGYTDYSTDPTRLVTLVRGGTASVSVAKTWPGYQYSFLTGVWIDFNRNGVFEATERVLTSPSNTTTPVTATFNIPNAGGGAYTGNLTTRMRVVMNEYSPINACGTYSYGETEDYAVKLIDLSACTTAPPSDIQVNNVTPSSANVTWTSTTGATYIVRYRVSPSGAWQQIAVNTPLVSNQMLTGLLEQTAYDVQVATVCGGTTGAFSPTVTFTTPALTYCTAGPTSNTATSGYINNVTVTPTNTPIMLSNSGSDNYKDYTPDPTRVVIFERGSANNKISVNKYWPGSPTSYGVSAWVDFNRNGTFETSERILNTTYNTTTPVTATFAVPTVASGNVYTGTLPTRMRVVMRYFDNATQCGTFTQGEVEDYAVKFVDSQPCSTAPPTNITVNNIGATTATVSWVATVGATYNIRWRTTPGGVWQTATVPAGQNFYGITGLTEQTNYEVQVSTTCGGSTGVYSSSVTFTTPPLSYCPMTGTGTNDHISNVTVTSSNLGVPPMNNTSVQTNYTSYTTPETLITLDVDSQNNKISVAKGWTGATGNDAVTAWIDFDRNGQFTDAERILISPANTTTPVTATFAVPSTSYTGPLTTTMRVVLKRTSAPVMCQNAVDGEVEDYRVRIRPCSNATPNAPTFTTTHTTATVTITGAGVSYVVRYRVQGTTPWTSVYASTQLGNLPLVISNLTPATTYEVEVAAICGDIVGTATPIKTFTTRCDPTPPNVTVGNITPTTALITWAPLAASSTYTMRWRKVGTTAWTLISLPAAPANTYVLGSVTPLEPFTTYEVQIANMCNGETALNPYSNPKVFTTERICEIPPPGLTITQLLPTSAAIQWDPFPGATYVLRYRKVGIPSWTEVPSLVNNLVLTGLTELTKYEMQVVNICNGTPGNYTPPYYFTTPTVIYCQMHSGSSTGEHISKVTVKPTGKKTMENESGASTYTDYTGVPKTFIEMIQGSTDNEIIIEKKWTGNTYNEGIAVWIDFNRNGEFDINERVLSSPPNTDSPISGKFNVPADAFVSMTDYKYVVMRVAMERDGIPVNCASFKNGEVEDYTVRISKPIVANPIDQTGIMIYPNPVSSILFVKNISKRAKYKIYNAAGQVIGDGILLNNQINVSRLINGVYVIDIDDNGKTVQKKFIKE